MPMLAFGSFNGSFSDCTVQEGVEQWLRLGGRHIDTADNYGTQPFVGRALQASGVPRSEVFLTTKINGPIGKASVIETITNTALPQLGVDYIDLVLVHYPCKAPQLVGCGKNQSAERLDTWAGLLELRQKGKIRAIGVSNYDEEQVQEVLDAFAEAPAVNQVEFHLGYHNETLVKKMHEMGTILEAWSALSGPTSSAFGHPGISLSDSRLVTLSEKYNVTTAQIVFRWMYQKQVVPVTATCNAAYAAEDLTSFGFELGEDSMALLDALVPDTHIIV